MATRSRQQGSARPAPRSEGVRQLVLERIDLLVRRADARGALRDFLRQPHPRFDTRQDALWEGESLLSHSRLCFVPGVDWPGAGLRAIRAQARALQYELAPC